MEFTYEGITSVILEAQSHRRLPCEARDSVQNVKGSLAMQQEGCGRGV